MRINPAYLHPYSVNALRHFERIPEGIREEMACKLYCLMNLTWGYVETICDLAAQMRIQETKPLTRKVRALKDGYDKFRSRDVRDEQLKSETECGEYFEEAFSADFDKLFCGLYNEVSKLGLKRDHAMLVTAVHQALTLMDAVKKYARQCDKMIASYGLWSCDCCMVEKHFLGLYPLIHQFAGDCYKADIEARKLTANIIVNRLNSVKVLKYKGENGGTCIELEIEGT